MTLKLKEFNRMDTIGNYSKKLSTNKLHGNDQRRAVDSIKHCEKRLPLK